MPPEGTALPEGAGGKPEPKPLGIPVPEGAGAPTEPVGAGPSVSVVDCSPT